MAFLTSGNKTVDQMETFQLKGNIISPVWFYTINTESGKSDLLAIFILSDIVYWYRPIEIRDETTGKLVELKKKFANDLLQKTYDQYAMLTKQSKEQVKKAFSLLEKIGVIRRIFRTVQLESGTKIPNVMFVDLNLECLRKISDPTIIDLQKVSGASGGCTVFEGDISGKKGVGEETSGQSGQKLPEVLEDRKGPKTEEYRESDDPIEPEKKEADEHISPQKKGGYPPKTDIPMSEKGIYPNDSSGTNTENTTENTNRDNSICLSGDKQEERSARTNRGTDRSDWINDQLYSPEERREHVLQNTDYSWHMIHDKPLKRKEYEDLVNLVCDVVCGEYMDGISIGKARLPANIVKERFWNIDSTHIEYVIEQLDQLENRKGIRNMKNYLLTCLYNAPITCDQHYKQKYNHNQSESYGEREKGKKNDGNEEIYEGLLSLCGA